MLSGDEDSGSDKKEKKGTSKEEVSLPPIFYDVRPYRITKAVIYGYYYGVRMPIRFLTLAPVHLTYGMMHYVTKQGPSDIINLGINLLHAPLKLLYKLLKLYDKLHNKINFSTESRPQELRAIFLKVLMLGATITGALYLWREQQEKIKPHLNWAMELISPVFGWAPAAVRWLNHHIRNYDTFFGRIWDVITHAPSIIQNEFHKVFEQQGFVSKLMPAVAAFVAGLGSKSLNPNYGSKKDHIDTVTQTSRHIIERVFALSAFSCVFVLGFACGMPIGTFASNLFGVAQYAHLAQLVGGAAGARLSQWGILLVVADDRDLPDNVNFHSLRELGTLCWRQAKVDTHNALSLMNEGDKTALTRAVNSAPKDRDFIIIAGDGRTSTLPANAVRFTSDGEVEYLYKGEHGTVRTKIYTPMQDSKKMKQPDWNTKYQDSQRSTYHW